MHWLTDKRGEVAIAKDTHRVPDNVKYNGWNERLTAPV
jgi:hypothetical protein